MLTGNFCRPIHCPRPGARASKERTRASAHIKWLFSTKQVVSPVLTSATGAAFLVCARKQRGTPFSSPATPPGNSHIVQPRRQPGDGSAEKQREIPTKRTGETTCFFPAHREKPRVWALESHVTDNFTLRTMREAFIHIRNVQQICYSAQTGQHSRLQRSCCPVWALQHIHLVHCTIWLLSTPLVHKQYTASTQVCTVS